MEIRSVTRWCNLSVMHFLWVAGKSSLPPSALTKCLALSLNYPPDQKSHVPRGSPESLCLLLFRPATPAWKTHLTFVTFAAGQSFSPSCFSFVLSCCSGCICFSDAAVTGRLETSPSSTEAIKEKSTPGNWKAGKYPSDPPPSITLLLHFWKMLGLW